LYYQKGEIAKSDEFLTKAVAANANDIDTQYYLGLIRYKQNRNDEAVVAFKKFLAVIPNSAEAHFYLGETFDRLSREPEAFAEYNEAVRLNPNYLEAWFDLGVANYNRGRYEEAVNAYKQVIRIKSDYGQAHANLADVYRQMAMDAKDQKKKREYFGLANGSYTLAELFLKGNNDLDSIKQKAEFYSNWGFCLGQVEKWDNAVKRLNTAVELSPDASDYSNIGWAYQNAAVQDLKAKRDADARIKLEKGKDALQKSIALKPKFFPAFQNLGSVLLDLGDNQGAVNALKTAAELRKDFFPTILSLAIGYRGLNDLDNAAKQFRRVTELDGSFQRAWYNLSEIEYRRGNMKEARKAQDKLRALNPALADQLNVILSGAVFQGPQNKIENKIQEKNPLKKLPKLPF
jgi:tetratricopeptide (TPR) repeat protein